MGEDNRNSSSTTRNTPPMNEKVDKDDDDEMPVRKRKKTPIVESDDESDVNQKHGNVSVGQKSERKTYDNSKQIQIHDDRITVLEDENQLVIETISKMDKEHEERKNSTLKAIRDAEKSISRMEKIAENYKKSLEEHSEQLKKAVKVIESQAEIIKQYEQNELEDGSNVEEEDSDIDEEEVEEVEDEEEEEEEEEKEEEEVNQSECIFCKFTDHESIDCRQYPSWLLRRFKIIGDSRCLKCLEHCTVGPNKVHDPCPKANEPCQDCVGKEGNQLADHHPMLCKYNDKVSNCN